MLQNSIDAYRRLADARAQGLPFVSDWNGKHGMVDAFLGSLATEPVTSFGCPSNYAFPQEDADLQRSLATFHQQWDGGSLRPSVLMVGGGATALLSTVAHWIAAEGFREVLAFAPLHYTLSPLLELLGVKLRLVTEKQDFEEGFDLDLPEHSGCLLIFSDPVWFAGRSVRESTILEIRRWQQEHGNHVFVDGTFQYLSWQGDPEASRLLDTSLTLRLICPTKVLGLNGFRYSYLILPKTVFYACAQIHDLNHGTTSLLDLAFAKQATAMMLGRRQLALVAEAAATFRAMLASGLVAEYIEPHTGYFGFLRPTFDVTAVAAMGADYFGLSGHLGWIRVNFLSPVAEAAFGLQRSEC